MTAEPIDRPQAWRDAFAALPDAAPPADGWARLSTALDGPDAARRPSRRALLPFALAATVAVLAPVLALRFVGGVLPIDPTSVTSTPAASPSADGTGAPGEPVRASRTGKDAAPRGARQVARGADATSTDRARPDALADAAIRRDLAPAEAMPRSPAEAPSRAAEEKRSAAQSRGVATVGTVAATAKPRSIPGQASPSTDVESVASDDGRVAHVPIELRPDGAAPSGEPAPAAVDPLQPLYAEAAQLEALLSLARDERVASASGAALGDALVERLVATDFALAQPGLSTAQRVALWRDRVAALRQLAGVASTERWLAVHGRAYGDAFVRVD